MSRNERKRVTVMAGGRDEELTLVQAAQLMGVCYRQSKRIWQRYQAEGDAGLVHRRSVHPSLHAPKPPEINLNTPRDWRKVGLDERLGSTWSSAAAADQRLPTSDL